MPFTREQTFYFNRRNRISAMSNRQQVLDTPTNVCPIINKGCSYSGTLRNTWRWIITVHCWRRPFAIEASTLAKLCNGRFSVFLGEPVMHIVLSLHLHVCLSPSTISLCIDGPRVRAPVARTRTSRGGVNREVQLLVCRSAVERTRAIDIRESR